MSNKALAGMSETDTRKYIIEMLDEADLRVLRIIYRVTLGLISSKNREEPAND